MRPPPDGIPYLISPAASEIRIRVYKSGALARFGHNHVITITNLEGTVWLGETPAESAVDLTFPAAHLVVDDPAKRAAAGKEFPGELDADAIAGTRRNMLSEELLDAARHPRIAVRAMEVHGEYPSLSVVAEVTVRGLTREIVFPIEVIREPARIFANGATKVTHTDLGLTPFSAMLGALSVKDEFELEYEFVANRDL